MGIKTEVRNILQKSNKLSGKELRSQLNSGKWFWQRYSGPAFYYLMWKLEEDGLVKYTDVMSNFGINIRYYELK